MTTGYESKMYGDIGSIEKSLKSIAQTLSVLANKERCPKHLFDDFDEAWNRCSLPVHGPEKKCRP